MVAECVGLDIGQTAIKAVRFRRRLTGRESVEYFHLPLPYGRPEHAEPARRAGFLRSFLWQNGLYGSGDIVTSLPCQDLFIRTLSFPFRDAAKLEQVVPFEVENLIPMALDDVAMGSMVMPVRDSGEGSQKPKGADVLVTAAPRDKVTEHLKFLASADLKPAAIGVDGMALYSVTKFLQQEGARVPEDLAIIDVGATKTTLCLIQEGRPAVLRTVLWGGNHLTHALAARPGPDGQPETIGVVRTVADPDNVTAELSIVVRSDLKRRGLGTHLLRRAVEYCRSRGTRELAGDVLAGNDSMLALARRFTGFTLSDADEEGIVRIVHPL